MSVLSQLLGRTPPPQAAAQTIPGTDQEIPPWAQQLIKQNQVSPQIAQGDGSGIPPWVDMTALKNAAGDSPYEVPEPDTGAKTPWGLIGNLIGDVPQMVGGFASLLGMGAGDIWNLGREGLEKVGLADDQDKGFYTDDILKGLIFDPAKAQEGGIWKGIAPAIQEDIGHRYGGLSNLAEGLYNDPLFYLADAFSLGEAGGLAASRSAKAALPRVADELSEVGTLQRQLMAAQRDSKIPDVSALRQQVEDALAGLSPEAARVKRTLPGAGMGKFTPDEQALVGLPEDIPLAGYRTELDNVTGGKPLGRFVSQSANPFRRSVASGMRKLTTQPVSKLELRRAEFLEDIEGGTTTQGLPENTEFNLPETRANTNASKKLLTDADRLQTVIQEANRYGLDRVNIPAVDKFKMRKAVQTMLSDFTTAFYGRRNQATGRFAEVYRNYAEEAIRLKRPNASTREVRDLIDKDFMPRMNQIHQLDTPIGMRTASDIEQLRPVGTADIARNEHEIMRTINEMANARGGTLVRERMVIEVNNYQQARAIISDIRNQMGLGDDMILLPDEAGGQIGYILVDTPSGRVKIRVVDKAGNEVLAATDHLFEMEARLNAALSHPEVMKMLGKGDTTVRDGILKQQAAVLRTIRDQTEHMLNSMDTHIGKFVEPMAKLHAHVRTISYDEMTRIALDEGKMHMALAEGLDIPDFLGIRARMFMPAQIERIAMAGDDVKKLVMSIRKRQQDGDSAAELVAELEDKLKAGTGGLLDQFTKKAGDTAWLADKLNNTGYDTMGVLAQVDLLDELEAAYSAAGRSSPVYFPNIELELGSPADYLMRKKLTGGNQQRTAARFKQFTGWLYVEGKYATNPLEVYSRAASQVRQYQAMGEFYQKIVDFGGREINRIDDFNPEAEALMAPDLFNKLTASKLEVELGFMKSKLDGTEDFEGLVQAMSQFQRKLDAKVTSGETTEALNLLYNQIHDLFPAGDIAAATKTRLEVGLLDDTGATPSSMMHEMTADPLPHTVNNRKVKIYAVPRVMADQIDQMAKQQFGWKTRVFWDGPVNLWKAAVLSYSPRWIFYNLLGNMTFLKMQGGSLTDAVRILFGKLENSKRMTDLVGEGAFTSKFLKAHEEVLQRAAAENPGFMFRLRGSFFSDVNQNATHLGEAAGTTPGRLMEAVKSRPGSQRLSRGATKMRRLNELIEESFREAAFVTALERQAAATGVKNVGKSFIRSSETLENLMKNGMDDATVGKALDEVDYFLNNYSRLSPLERNVVKRFLMPFYSFYKHIVRLSVTYPFEHPLRASVMRQMGELSREMATEFGAMPDWLVGSVPIGQGESEGETRFLNTRGLNPFNALQNPLESLGTSITPQLKMFYEQATGQSMLTGKPFSHPDVITPFGSNQQYRVNPDTGNVDPTTVRPNIFYQLAQQFPQFKLFQDIASSIQGPGPGARYTATGDVIVDQEGNPLYPDDLLVNIASLGGISQTDFQLSKFQEQQAGGERLALIEWLKRNGYLEDAPA